MKIQIHPYHKATLITLENDAGMRLTLSDIGAGLRDVFIDDEPMLCSPFSQEEYLYATKAFYGKTIGPICGRIRLGAYEAGGKTCQMKVNDGVNALHSSSLNFASVKFDYSFEDSKEGVSLIFAHRQKAIPGVYPANLDVKITYFLPRKAKRFEIFVSATPDADAPINITNHSYFKLGGAKSILGAKLKINASKVATYTDDLICTGTKKAVDALDFQKEKKIGQDIASPELRLPAFMGYDHAFVFKKNATDEAQVVLSQGKWKMELFTDAPAVQVYSLNFPRFLMLSSRKKEAEHSGITFEPVNVPGDPETFITKKGRAYTRHHVYRFQSKEADHD